MKRRNHMYSDEFDDLETLSQPASETESDSTECHVEHNPRHAGQHHLQNQENVSVHHANRCLKTIGFKSPSSRTGLVRELHRAGKRNPFVNFA